MSHKIQDHEVIAWPIGQDARAGRKGISKDRVNKDGAWSGCNWKFQGVWSLEEISTQYGPPKKNNKIIAKIIK